MILVSFVSFFIWMDHVHIFLYWTFFSWLSGCDIYSYFAILSMKYFLYRILTIWEYSSTIDGYLGSFPFEATQIAIVTIAHVSQLVYTWISGLKVKLSGDRVHIYLFWMDTDEQIVKGVVWNLLPTRNVFLFSLLYLSYNRYCYIHTYLSRVFRRAGEMA